MQSSGGKTAVTAVLLAALRKRGITVQPFKVGPDYIDPGYHFHYSGTPSVNLDPWIMGGEHIFQAARHFTESALGVAEGVMGLFDGSEPESDTGSTMEVARRLDWPIVLVVPCRNAGRSITAAIRGFVAEAGSRAHFAGIVLNQVNSESHEVYLRKACASLEIPVLGALPEVPVLRWPERHLGLQPGVERKLPGAERLAELAEKHLDIELLFKKCSVSPLFGTQKKEEKQLSSEPGRRIGIARDEAFHFYYAANLQWLREQGAEIIFFSPLRDPGVPEKVDGLILGGGFPEMFAEKMSKNREMLQSLKSALESRLPCYAECGGLMLLCESLKPRTGPAFPMAGVIPGTVEMTEQLQHFGYCRVDMECGAEVRGHEFHYSRWTGEAEHANLWRVTRHSTGVSRREGFGAINLHASYVHLYFPRAEVLIRRVLKL